MNKRIVIPAVVGAAVIGSVAAAGVLVDRQMDKPATEATASPSPSAEATASPSPSANVVPVNQGFTITKTKANVKGESGLIEVVGEIANETGKDVGAVALIATFYDDKGDIVGTARGVVNNLKAGDKRTFTLLGSDIITNYKELKVQTDTVLE